MNLSLKEFIIESERCVACGLCLPVCPTYRKTGSEADSPRGRIQLMRAVAQEILPNSPRFKEHIDLCLNCRSCESACPNSVSFGALIDTSRALFIPKKSRLFALAKPFIRHRYLSYGLSWSIWVLQKLKLSLIVQYFVPSAKILPALQSPVLWKTYYPAIASKKGAVSLFLGCASNAFDSQTLTASIYVLNKLGMDVHVPSEQTCCGSIARQMGDASEAEKLVRLNAAGFKQDIPLISSASGCGSGLKDYLTDHQIQDISAFLMTCDWSNINLSALPERIYVQDPCSLRNVQKNHQAVYSLLKKIPLAQIYPLPGNNQCCGGAGAYILTQNEMAMRLSSEKLIAIRNECVTTLATSNIGCSLHIAKALREQHIKVSVLHPVQIIAKQMGFTGTI